LLSKEGKKGKVITRYRILGVISPPQAGGMERVYKGENAKVGEKMGKKSFTESPTTKNGVMLSPQAGGKGTKKGKKPKPKEGEKFRRKNRSRSK
jgi:hypothetical protein